jgi:replicative DNA helicase
MIDEGCARDAAADIPKDAFFSESNRMVHSAIVALIDTHDPVDIVSVSEMMRRQKSYGNAEANVLLKKCIDAVSTVSHYGHYASQVRMSYYWRMIEKCAIRVKDDPSDEKNMEELQRFATMRASETSAKYFEFKRDLHSVVDVLEQPLPKKEIVQTGFRDLDELLYGVKTGSLFTVGARPGVGKTAFCSKLAINMARRGLKVFAFSTEMTELEMVERIIPIEARVFARAVRFRTITADGFKRIGEAMDDLRTNCDVVLYANPRPSLRDIRGAVSRTQPDVVIVDYLQRCRFPDGIQSMAYAVEAFVKGLKDIALESRCRIVLAAQLNRQKDNTPDQKPRMADLRDSGGVEHQSDQIVLLHEPKPDESAADRTIEAVVVKNRGGLLGCVNLKFEKSYVNFTDMEIKEEGDGY